MSTNTKEAPLAHEGLTKQELGHENHQHLHKVEIKINGQHYKVPEGLTSVSQLKQVAGIPLADVLAQVVHGQLAPLPNGGEINVKAGDTFVSYPRQSSSS